MKKSLLLISCGAFVLLLSCCKKTPVVESRKPAADTVPVGMPHAFADSAQLIFSDTIQVFSKTGRDSFVVITHTAPNQAYIDSVKAAKLKEKGR